MKTKQQKINTTIRCKQDNHLVLSQQKKADNTDTEQYNFIV